MRALLLLWLVSGLAFGQQNTQQHSAVLISGVTLIDGTNKPPRSDMTILIKGNRVAVIDGDSLLDEVDDGNTFLIDGDGCFVIPGLFDAHVHNSNPRYGMEEVERNFLLFLANGVTSTIDVGGDLSLGLKARERVRKGRIPGPRVFLAGPVLHCRNAQTPEEVKTVVNGLIDQGIDLVKFYICWTPPMVKAAIEAAHARGIPVSGHHGLTSPMDSALYGTDIIHHALTSLGEMALPNERREEMLNSTETLEQIGKEVQLASWDAMGDASQQELNGMAQRLAATGTCLASTFIVNHCYLTYRDPFETYDGHEYLSESGRAFWDRKSEEVISSLKACPTVITPEKLQKRNAAVYQFWESGGNLLAGTDVPSLGQVCGFSLQNELVLLQKASISPAEVITSATRNPARAVGHGDELGTVEVGRLADLLVLEANPLVDAENTRQIRFVIKDGRVYEPKKLLSKVLKMNR